MMQELKHFIPMIRLRPGNSLKKPAMKMVFRWKLQSPAIIPVSYTHLGNEVKFACVDGQEFDGHRIDFDQAIQRQQMYRTTEGRAVLKAAEGDTHHGGCGNCGGDEE